MPPRDITLDDHRQRISRVLLHIEQHLDEPLSLETLAAIACFSPFHFHRLFAAHVGETLHSHVRRLRLERGAMRLAHGEENVTGVALQAGYETPAAFTRAFRERFGVSPTDYRKERTMERCLEREGTEGVTAAEEAMPIEADIRKFPETRVLFARRTGHYGAAAAGAWETLMKFAYSRRLMTKDTLLIGISHDDPSVTPEESIRYDACITFTGDVKPEGEVGVKTIAGGRYAVFLHKGPYEGFAQTYRSIFSRWLPESGEKLRDAPCFELYLNRDPRRTKPENLRTEIWVPVE